MGQVLDLEKEAPQAGTHSDDLMINQSIAGVIQVLGSTAMDMGNIKDLSGVAKNPIEVKNDERFTWGSWRRCREGASYLLTTLW